MCTISALHWNGPVYNKKWENLQSVRGVITLFNNTVWKNNQASLIFTCNAGACTDIIVMLIESWFKIVHHALARSVNYEFSSIIDYHYNVYSIGHGSYDSKLRP